MLKRLGIECRIDLAIFLSLALLVAVSPLGNEGTHPVVLGVYRVLLLVLIAATTRRTRQYGLPQISVLFLGSVGVVVLAMYASVLLRAGSHFDGIYTFYQNTLFLAAFISLASFNRTRTSNWKNAILSLVILIDIVYLTVAWLHGTRPLLGPFVNPNYFASYLLAGFAICVSCVLFARTLPIRIGATLAALIFFYGIGQTSSRGAFISLLAILSVALFRIARRNRTAWWKLAVIGTLIIVIAAAANPSLVRKFTDRGQHDPYNYERAQIWLKTLSMIATHPVLGVGLGRYYYVSKLFTPAVEGGIGRYGKWPNIAHSEYLQYLAELGIPVALLMFAIGAYLFRLAWRRAGTIEPEFRIFQEAALLTAIGLGTHALVDNNWTVPVVAAALAVISLADLLPFRPRMLSFEWTPVRKAALGVSFALIFVQSIGVPVLSLYFNEAGHQAYAAGNFQRAEQMHRLGLGFAPDHPVLLDNLGMVYFDGFVRMRKPEFLDRAESLFRDSIAANATFDLPAGHLETVLFQRLTGDPARDQAIHALIVETDRLRLRANPYSPFIRKNLAEALYSLSQKQEAIAELKKSVELEPNYVPAYLRLAHWEEEAGHPGEAGEYRKKADDVVAHYKNQATPDPFEAMLLDRPLIRTGKP